MKKLSPNVYQGNECMLLSRLPNDQMIEFKKWLNIQDILNLRNQFGEIFECVDYEEYDFWFDNIKGENSYDELSVF